MKSSNRFGCDLLVLSPHSDDAEIGLGGTLALFAHRGAKTWAVDLTQGELGTNATVPERWSEAESASAALGLTGRAQLELPDGFIDPADRLQVEVVVSVIRSLRPRWVVTAPEPYRHPDHVATPRLVAKACFMAQLLSLQPDPPVIGLWSGGASWPEPAEVWQVDTLLSVCPASEKPSLFFDISETWEIKKQALACYASQFDSGGDRRPTPINDPDFLLRIERRARNWGRRAGCDFAEAFQTESAPVLNGLPTGRWSE
ncbi:MAG: bacillithiol biosynthesis deacetylase BshB1 [Gemmatimonadales bacterium]|nr:bacillithiol biosynthesis deacetylase BshB1 [Gemmatimonadales bacterium]